MNNTKHISTFAAANGYSGFRSYFHEVFASENFSKIYVIKGGPGTGKSSFMKRLLREYSEYAEEAIYCSSDPNSLDGVILSGDGGRVALLDGTAPHIRDAEVPGAIDEIMNLGEFWDSRWLCAKRERILSLTDEKKKAYKTAYRYLSLAGKMKESEIKAPAISARTLAEIVGEIKADDEYKQQTRLISAFGKEGLIRLPTLTEIADEIIEIRGGERSMLLCNRIADYLSDNSTSHTRFPYALDGSLTEAIYIPSCGRAIVCYSPEGKAPARVIEEVQLYPAPDRTDIERRRVALEFSREMESEAQRWFSIASELHFELEEIYSQAMNYSLVDELYAKKSLDILNIIKS